MNKPVKVVKPRAPRMSVVQMNKFVRSKGVQIRTNQIKLTEPLFVYKKIYSNVNGSRKSFVASLVVPTGAIVNLAAEGYHSEGKMRATVVFCYSIVSVKGNADGDRQCVDSGYSGWDWNFRYYAGASLGLTLDDFKNLSASDPGSRSNFDSKKRAALNQCKAQPKGRQFEVDAGTCAPGIHFFLEQHKAVGYST